MAASTWFLIALVLLALGVALLVVDRVRDGGGSRDRRRWAAERGWEYHDSDPVLPSRWRFGTIHQGGPGIARAVASGSVTTSDGLRHAFVFDHEQAGRVGSVVVAVQVIDPLPGAVELRLPSAPLPDDAGLDLLQPVGERYAFVSDAEAVRPLLTHRLADAGDAVGDDVELLWAEDAWVLAAAPVGSTTARIEELLDDVAAVATALDHGQGARHRLER